MNQPPRSICHQGNFRRMKRKTVPVVLAAGGLLLGAWGSPLIGQLSLGNSREAREWHAARDAFEKEKYAAALHGFESWQRALGNAVDGTPEATEAEFKAAMSAMMLYHPDAPERIAQFVRQHPDSPFAPKALWELARFYYTGKQWQDAVVAFNQLRPKDLNRTQEIELHFKRGHAQFEQGDWEAARKDLIPVMESGGTYASPALYYFSHIAYLTGQPQVALDGFQKLAQEEAFQGVVPIYICQLLHETEQFDALIDYAPDVLAHPDWLKDKQKPGIARLLGDALYRRQAYDAAAPHLDLAWSGTPSAERSREFAYQVAYVRYHQQNWREAINLFALVTRGEADAMTQNAHYHMARCYLGLEEKDKARTAFREAAAMTGDPEIQEDALFSHAKLAFELSYNPFDDAITAFERYLQEFPQSKRRDEAYSFLLDVYMTSKNYARALEALDQIRDKDVRVRRAYQLVAYNHAVELFRAGKYDDSERFFEKVRVYPLDAQLAAESHYWQGELNYLAKRYTESAGHYAEFLKSPGAYNSPYYAEAEYARGYALFKRKSYTDALSAFRAFLKEDKGTDPKKTRDALLRTADCYYVGKRFEEAASRYAEVIQSGNEQADYARFQRGLCLGAQGNGAGLVQQMNDLLEKHPKSPYVAEARYESGRALIELNRLGEARASLEALLRDFPNSPRTKYVLVDLCLIGMKEGREDDVMQIWDRIRAEYPKDAIAADAFQVVEPLLIERGLLDQIPPGVGLQPDEIEQRLYDAGAGLALKKECNKAVARLGEYIRQYPNGRHLVEAHYFLGTCQQELKDESAALLAFSYVLDQPVNDFTENAASFAAAIAWKAQDLVAARRFYQILESSTHSQNKLLEARVGLMRCHYLLEDYEAAQGYTDWVLNDDQTPEDIRRTARFWRGKLRFREQNWIPAYDDLAEVAKFGGSRGAEAKYLMAQVAFQRRLYPAAETEVFELIDAFSAYDEWKYKAFLLLIEVYMGMEDYYQARVTANSILEQVEVPWVQTEARRLLTALDAREAASSGNNPESPTPQP